MRLLHFSPTALIVAGGIVLLAYGIQTVLGTARAHRRRDAADRERAACARRSTRWASRSSSTRPGSRRPSIFSAEAADVRRPRLCILVGVVLAIAVLDLVVLWLARPIGARIPAEGIIVLEQVLGVLLAAVAVELIVIGLGQLGIIDVVPH